ncbi:MAG: STAS domain-containing protein [Planctomycetota bacterium]|jgi:anti-anti-sigma factor
MERVDEILIVKPHGRLSVREGHELLAAIFEEVGARPRDVIVDLSGVSDMSSWGFALVCGLARKLAEMGHSLRIAGPTPFVRKYLEIFTGMKQPIRFHDNREDALRQARLGRNL